MLKEYIVREQWDFHYEFNFMYFNKHDEYVGRATLSVSQDSVFLSNFYIDETQRCNNYSNIILKKVIEYSNKYVKRNIQLYVRRDNFIYKKYTELGFKFINENGVYDLLKLKYKKPKKNE